MINLGLLILFSLLSRVESFSAFTKDCFVRDLHEKNHIFQCYTGTKLIPISSKEFNIFIDTNSERKIAVSSFYMAYEPVSKRQYFHYLKKFKQKIDPVLSNLNKITKGPYAVGVHFEEAQEFCKHYGMNIPSEAEWLSSFHTKEFTKVDQNEWLSDYYRESPHPSYKGLNPINQTPNQYKVIRNKNLYLRSFQRIRKRNSNTLFRCQASIQKFQRLQKTYDYPQFVPIDQLESSHLVLIKTTPRGAKIFKDKDYNHYLGRSPLLVFPDKKVETYIINKKGYKPQQLVLQTPPNYGQEHKLDLIEIPPNRKIDNQRKNEMVLIPAGRVKIGLSEFDQINIHNRIAKLTKNRDLSEEQIRRYIKHETPDRIVYVNDFYIDETEVSYGQYKDYLELSGEKSPRCAKVRRLSHDEQPVTCITWLEAQSFCSFYNKALPTEIQWEKASKRSNNRPITAWIRRPQKSKALNADKSRYGVFDMAGNVMEWTYDWYSKDFYQELRVLNKTPNVMNKSHKVVRGASFDSKRQDTRITKRRHYPPGHFALDLGFRCVAKVK
ncbi:MAG: SUMF1/EgtB/PvdO family nonheme iron enzyme [Candidatus Cloacimonetes bacterium]|nr:SUMF1/EgtB/PvdO family nonheme iron enzyme [Candidatus Cloacimonadota bacterium]